MTVAFFPNTCGSASVFFVTESEALPADIKENLSSTIRVTVRSFFLPGNLMVIRHSEI